MHRRSYWTVLKLVHLVENGKIESLDGRENQALSVINGNRYGQIKLDSLTIFCTAGATNGSKMSSY